jgi:hypothetical protein
MNILFRTPDGALFETFQAARAHGSGAAHIAAQTWCSDCGEWVPAGRDYDRPERGQATRRHRGATR